MSITKISILLFLLLPFSAKAIGVSVSPAAIDLLYPDDRATELVIKNISLEPIIVYIYPDDHKDKITVNPEELSLLPEEYGQINVAFDFSKEQNGVKNTQLSIVSKAVDKRSFNAASGLKIPLSININKEPWHWSGPAVFTVVFLGLLILVILLESIALFFKPRKKKPWYEPNFLLKRKKMKFWGK
ncbi:hypothetical protein C4566_01130 [Candidatus Parcubacteria bacterium]|nr:MAG: hypothetical protein C4566_01130 [Candidatus Parcubacteria bacterium]